MNVRIIELETNEAMYCSIREVTVAFVLHERHDSPLTRLSFDLQIYAGYSFYLTHHFILEILLVPVNKRMNECLKHSASQSITQPAGQPVSQSVSLSVSQSASQ